METKKEKILEKLRKLMNLKESAVALGNEGEANAAAAGITRLLMQYNLSENDIPEQEKLDNPIVAERIPFKSEVCSGVWFTHLISVVSEYNLCRALIVRAVHNGKMRQSEFEIVGRKKNVEVVLFLISFLSNQFVWIGKQGYMQYKRDCIKVYDILPKSPATYLKSFLYGCVLGLIKKFEGAKQQLENETNLTALMVTTKSEIDVYLSNEKIKSARKSQSSIDPLSASRGFKVGKNIEIYKGIHADRISEERGLQ